MAKCVLDKARQFALTLRSSYNSYPTVLVQDPTTDKEREIQQTDYPEDFTSNWTRFSLAKMVARFTLFNLKAVFMQPFNELTY